MLDHPHQKSLHQFAGNFHAYLHPKTNFITICFLKILQRYCKFVLLDTFGMPGYAYPRWYYQLVGNNSVYLQKKSTPSQNDSINLQKTLMFIWMPKINLSFTFFLRYYILKNLAIWLANSILAHNSRTIILPHMGLVEKYQ